jgi:DNA-binding response OmpR family regulator
MLTGFSTVDSAVRAMRNGAMNYLQKPASKAQILESVKEGLAQAQRERQRNKLLLKARQLLESSLQQLDEVMPASTDPVVEADTLTQVADPDRFLQKGPLVIDLYRRKATLNEELLDLTAGEYDLLLCLVQKAPQVLSPQALVRETRGYECSLSEARELIRWQVYLLRQKVETDPSAPQYILNVRGRGYMWAAA